MARYEATSNKLVLHSLKTKSGFSLLFHSHIAFGLLASVVDSLKQKGMRFCLVLIQRGGGWVLVPWC